MFKGTSSFIVYFFSFLFNKLYFNIFKIFKNYGLIVPKLYSTYTITKKIKYFIFLVFLCITVFCKILFFIYYYILLYCNIIIKVYINLIIIFKKKYYKFIYLLFFMYWFNLLIHLKVLNRKFEDKIDLDFVYYALKWICFYFYFYIIYMFKDLISIVYWCMLQFLEYQWYILYLQIIFYFKNRKLEFIYYIKLFIKGFLGIYCFSGIIFYIKNTIKWKRSRSFKKRNKNVSYISSIKFKYHRNNRILKEKYYSNVKKPIMVLNYFINNLIESAFYFLLKTGANSIIYYFYKIFKYSYSICVYLWKSDVIYRFLKFFERKKW
jgi:hypothetical protein